MLRNGRNRQAWRWKHDQSASCVLKQFFGLSMSVNNILYTAIRTAVLPIGKRSFRPNVFTTRDLSRLEYHNSITRSFTCSIGAFSEFFFGRLSCVRIIRAFHVSKRQFVRINEEEVSAAGLLRDRS